MRNFNRVKLVNTLFATLLIGWAGHHVYVYADKQLQKTKKQVALWALNNVEISDRELTERGFYPVSVAIPPTCIRLCNDVVTGKQTKAKKNT